MSLCADFFSPSQAKPRGVVLLYYAELHWILVTSIAYNDITIYYTPTLYTISYVLTTNIRNNSSIQIFQSYKQ